MNQNENCTDGLKSLRMTNVTRYDARKAGNLSCQYPISGSNHYYYKQCSNNGYIITQDNTKLTGWLDPYWVVPNPKD